jgi:hypothetical protein
MPGATNFFVKVNPKESSEKRVSRFKQWYNRSRVGMLLKSRRYRGSNQSKRKIRNSALKREEYRAINERNKFYS